MSGRAIRGVSAAALVLALAGCGGEDPRAAFEAGDYARALAGWEARAARGDAEAQTWIGLHYQLGLGVPRDLAEAARRYRRAALAGDARAQRNLGLLYQAGLGVPKDNLRAYGWFYAAWQGGNRLAKRYLEAMGSDLTPNQTMQARALVQRLLTSGERGDAGGGGLPGAEIDAAGS